MRKYGIEPPETWEEFLAACETLKGTACIPITIGTKYRWTAAAWFDYLNMRVNGPEFHINLMLGKESYDDPRVKEVFTVLDAADREQLLHRRSRRLYLARSGRSLHDPG